MSLIKCSSAIVFILGQRIESSMWLVKFANKFRGAARAYCRLIQRAAHYETFDPLSKVEKDHLSLHFYYSPDWYIADTFHAARSFVTTLYWHLWFLLSDFSCELNPFPQAITTRGMVRFNPIFHSYRSRHWEKSTIHRRLNHCVPWSRISSRGRRFVCWEFTSKLSDSPYILRHDISVIVSNNCDFCFIRVEFYILIRYSWILYFNG